MSIKITTAAGATVYDDDLAAAISCAHDAVGVGVVALLTVLNHLELLAQTPEVHGDATAFAASTALELIRAFADAGGIDVVNAEVPVA